MEITAEELRQVRDLTRAALAFRDEAAWDYIGESQVFALRDPETEEQLFVSVRGQLGGPPGLGLFRGDVGFHSLWRLAYRPLPSLDERAAITISGLFLELHLFQDLPPDARRPLEAIGLTFDPCELAPRFFVYLPDFVPGGPDCDEIRLLTLALQQALELAPDVAEGRVGLARQGRTWLERRLFRSGNASMWGNVRAEPEIGPIPRLDAPYDPDELTCAHLARLPLAPGELWELDLVPLTEILELDPDERWPVVLRFTIVDRATGTLLHHEPVPAPGRYERVGRWLAEAAIALGFRPEQLRVRDHRLRARIALVAKAMGCKLITMRYLDATDEAAACLREQIPPGTRLKPR